MTGIDKEIQEYDLKIKANQAKIKEIKDEISKKDKRIAEIETQIRENNFRLLQLTVEKQKRDGRNFSKQPLTHQEAYALAKKMFDLGEVLAFTEYKWNFRGIGRINGEIRQLAFYKYLGEVVEDGIYRYVVRDGNVSDGDLNKAMDTVVKAGGLVLDTTASVVENHFYWIIEFKIPKDLDAEEVLTALGII